MYVCMCVHAIVAFILCREMSTDMLKNAKDGTFLVRPTNRPKVPNHVYTVDIK